MPGSSRGGAGGWPTGLHSGASANLRFRLSDGLGWHQADFCIRLGPDIRPRNLFVTLQSFERDNESVLQNIAAAKTSAVDEDLVRLEAWRNLIPA